MCLLTVAALRRFKAGFYHDRGRAVCGCFCGILGGFGSFVGQRLPFVGFVWFSRLYRGRLLWLAGEIRLALASGKPMTMETNNLNQGIPPMTETAVKAAQERINYYTRLVLAFFALFVVMSSGLIVESRSGEFDILSTIGTGLAVSSLIVTGYLAARINKLIRRLEKQ